MKPSFSLCKSLDCKFDSSGMLRLDCQFLVHRPESLTDFPKIEDVHLVFGRHTGNVCVVETPADKQMEMPEYCLMANEGMTPIAFFYDKGMAEYVCNILNGL